MTLQCLSSWLASPSQTMLAALISRRVSSPLASSNGCFGVALRLLAPWKRFQTGSVSTPTPRSAWRSQLRTCCRAVDLSVAWGEQLLVLVCLEGGWEEQGQTLEVLMASALPSSPPLGAQSSSRGLWELGGSIEVIPRTGTHPAPSTGDGDSCKHTVMLSHTELAAAKAKIFS